MTYQLHHGNMLDILPMMERESIDAIVTDPPYGLGFMGKDWDHGVPGEHFWREAYRCAKPGAYLLAFGGTRTFHRLAVAIEDAGWEIRDCIQWVYGSGFPKSTDVSKRIDKEAGAEREVIGRKAIAYPDSDCWGTPNRNTMDKQFSAPNPMDRDSGKNVSPNERNLITAPATPAAAEWDGWGTALKPAWEPIIVARKPLQGTVAENVQRYGTGAMNIDGCRIGTERNVPASHSKNNGSIGAIGRVNRLDDELNPNIGRWPANLIHDGSAEVLAGFPMTNAQQTKSSDGRYRADQYAGSGYWGSRSPENSYADTGSAARFFYCAKASKQDRDEGCEGLSYKPSYMVENGSRTSGKDGERWDRETVQRNNHPTVKPTALMRYLCRLVTPPNGVILDPFMGSGSTGKAAMLEGFSFVGVDTEIEYVEIAARRIEHACGKVGIVIDQPMMFDSKRETVDRPKQLILL